MTVNSSEITQPMRGDRLLEHFDSDLSGLGKECLSIVKEGATREPEAACEDFSIPVGNLAYVISNLAKPKANMLGGVGGLPYQLMVTPWMIDKVKSASSERPTISSAIQEIISSSTVGYHPVWRIRSLLLCQRHWHLAREMIRADRDLGVIAFNVCDELEGCLEHFEYDQLDHLAILTRNKIRIHQSTPKQVAFVTAELGALDQVLQTFHLSGSATAIHKGL